MRSAKTLVEEAVKNGLAPMLKRHGFKKTAFNFSRRQGTTAHLLNLQLSQWNQGSKGQFYVNAGVMFDDMCRLRGDEPPVLPNYGDCDFMVRWESLNPQLPPSITVDESTKPEVLSEWLSRRVEEFFVIPLNSVFSTHDFAQTGWVSAIPWGFPAKFHFLVGNAQEARRLVQLEANAFSDRGCTFQSVAASLRLPLAD